ncbi:MAG TPA: ribbon-helix-helix protein, CopG family, partial [Phycisphaerae bacterium]|nr:ribbon-helix-helix protein, CopG family [Phycisphaerae bacterium]
MSRKTMTISLPIEMVRHVDVVRKREHRTRSELVREALRVYLGSDRVLSVYSPTQSERAQIREGRAAIQRGRYHALDEFRSWLL